MSHFQTFGCRAWKFNEEAKKWDPKALPMVLIGYEPGLKVYRLWDPKLHKIVVSANVWFTETELLYQPPKPAPPASTPKPPVPSSSKVKLPNLPSIPWSLFDDSDEDSPKPSHPPESPTPNAPTDLDPDPDNVYDNDDDRDVTPPPPSQFPTPPSDSPKPETPSKSSGSDNEPEVPGALNPEGGIHRSGCKRKQMEKYTSESSSLKTATLHQEKGRQLIYLSRLFHLIPCHLDASKMSKHGLGLYNVNN